MKAKQKIQQNSKDQHQQFLDKYLQQSNKQKFSKQELEQLEQLLDVLTKAMNQEQKVGGDFQQISEQIKQISDSLKGPSKLSEILNSKQEITLTNQYGLKVKFQLQADIIRGSLLSQKQLDALVQQQTQQKQIALMFLSKIQGVTNMQSTLNDQVIPSYDIQHILNTNKLQQKSVQKQIRDNTQVSSKDEISVINKKIEQQFVQQNLGTIQSSSKIETKIEPEKKVPVKTKKFIKLIFKQQDTKQKQIPLSTESKNCLKTSILFQTINSVLNEYQNIDIQIFKQPDIKYINIKQTQAQNQIYSKIETQIEIVKSVTKKINRQVKNNINEQPEVTITNQQIQSKQKDKSITLKEHKKELIIKKEIMQESTIKKIQQQKMKEPTKTGNEQLLKIKENIEPPQNITQGKSKGTKVYRKLKTAKTENHVQNKLNISQTPQIQRSQSIHKIEQHIVAKRSKSFKHRDKCQKYNKETTQQIKPNQQEIKQVTNQKQLSNSDDKILHTPKQKKSSVKVDLNLSFSPKLSNSQDFSKLNRQQEELAKIKKIEQQLHDYDNLTEIDCQIHKKPLKCPQKFKIHEIEDDTSEADLYFQLEQYYQKLEDSIKNQETNSDPRYIATPLYSLLKNCKNVFKRLNTLFEQQKIIKSKYLEQFHFVIEQFQQASEYKKLLINRVDEIESKLYAFQKYVMYIASTDRDQAIINQQVEHSNLYLNLLKNTILSQKRTKFNIDSIREAIQVETEFLDMIKFATYQEFIQIKDKYNKMKASIQIEL
ncbi:Hypothetical_protein [Hexamita inflata]|uniref:Hypothetical_protein n=1 Tax=Hexamita inflata TaxID=28002 RepID=A0AA86UGF4_9EUKA|nr:Hypothetical protein HINF_LOCUS37802 [Hexamita inflata]